MASKSIKSVAEFYAGKSIFLTSGTGFIGKVFLEKLLYTCTNVDKVYVLVRERNGQTVEERIKNLTDKEIFSRIKHERPNVLSKIVPVAGDIRHDNLGIKQKDEQLLHKVSVVFHVAASIRFNERLDLSLNTNVEGTRRVLDLCRRLNHLQAFVHISTAFTNTDRKILEEKVYEPAAKLSDVYEFIKKNDVEDEEKIKKIINGRPNTYTFTKALTESLINEHDLKVPAIIIRPSIVSPAVSEPVVGWVDTWMGATGLLLSTAKGFNRVIFAKKEHSMDLIPVDYVANFMIVAAAKCDSCERVTVYNCCTSGSNPAYLRDIYKYVTDYSMKSGFNDIPYPTLLFTTNEKIEALATFILQTMPAYIADFWRKIRGKKPKYMEIQSQILFYRKLLKFFTAHTWVMRSERVSAVYSSLNSQDQQTFPCNPALITWRQYIPLYLQGIKRFLLKN